MSNERVRLQVKTSTDPAIWEDVGAGAVGVPVPVINEDLSINSDGSLNVVPNGSIVDDNNSTTTPILAGAVFTGTATEILHFAAIALLIESDVDSATNGLSVQFSNNATHWHDGESYTILAGSTKFFTPPVQAKYYRIVYTNGTVDQTTFHLHTILKKTPIKWSSHNITESIKDQDDAELVKAVITGKRTDGTYDNVNLTNGNNLKTSLEEFDTALYTEPLPTADFYLNVAKGLVPGHSIVSKFGQNDDLNTSTYEDVWDGGGTYTYPANGTAPITHLIGHDANDTEPIEAQGLDINGDLVVQTKTLTGLTKVALDTPLWRCFRLKNVGTSDLIADVCAINTGDTIDYACIANGNNQTLMALYTIPNGKTGYLLQGTNSLAGTSRGYAVAGRLCMRPYGLVFQLKKTFGLQSDGSSFILLPHPLPGKIPAKTDIRVSAISTAAGGVINTTFEILLVDD